MKNEKISILMTIFNHENFVASSIKSIIQQHHRNWELVAIDNGSKDNSAKILKKIKDKRIKKKFLKKNIGRTNCLNFGLKFCKSKYVAILDSDDISNNNRLGTQLKEFKLDKNLALVFSDFEYIDEKSKILQFPKVKFDFKKNLNDKPRELIKKNFIAHSTVMYRTDLLKKIGKYPTEYKYAQDYAFYLKVLKIAKIKTIRKKLVKIRVPHKQSETQRYSSSRLISIELIKILFSNLNNFNTSLKEKFSIFFSIIFILAKLCTPRFLINLKRTLL